MKTWLTADWHLGEDRFAIMQRPFSSPKEMSHEIESRHNDVVAPDDLVYHLGDVCYQKTPEWLEVVKNFNGRKILLRGNHDRVFSDSDLKPYFETVFSEGQSLAVEIQGIGCNLVHYPSLAKPNLFNLVGHIHGAWKYQLNSFNVGVDVNHFAPVNVDQIPFFFKAITEFYDQDVWAAYNEANMKYRGSRGKQGSYFQPTA